MNQLEEENNNLTLHESYSKFLNAVRENPCIAIDNIGLFDKDRIANQSNLNSYKSNIEKYFNASVESVDFVREGKAIQDMVNERVNSSTHGQIQQLMKEAPNPNTVALILNTVYFEGQWMIPFDEEMTSDQVFYTSDAKEQTVPFMNLTRTLSSSVVNASGQPSRVVRLRYRNNASMVILLPDEKDGLSHIIKDKDSLKESLTAALELVHNQDELELKRKRQRESNEMPKFVIVKDTTSFSFIDPDHPSLWPTKMRLQLPKFSLKKKMELKPILQSLGMTDMFLEGVADLTRISKNGNLFVSNVSQEAVVEVDEVGTRASAVTTLEITGRSSRVIEIIDVKADHPFLFLIRDDNTATILFVGVVNNIE